MDLKDLFNKWKHVVNGYINKNDAKECISKYFHNKELQQLLFSYVDAKKYSLCLDNISFMKHIDEIHKIKYKEDALSLINQIRNETHDVAQINTLMRIANQKIYRPININDYKNRKEIDLTTVTKRCPHCDIEVTLPRTHTYTICGYQDNIGGYDWIGCGRDWCFKCGKRLCKNWNDDQLFLLCYRLHDATCCMTHAYTNGLTYYDKYCQCKNTYVDRQP